MQSRTRTCLPPCGQNGAYTAQSCPFAGQVEREEVRCGKAPCFTLKDNYLGKLVFVTLTVKHLKK